MSNGPKSVGNVKIDFFGMTFGVKVLSAIVEQTLSEVKVHGACGRRLSFEQRCPHCDEKQKAPVKGGSAPPSKKAVYCTNLGCGKEIDKGIIEKAICDCCDTDVDKDEVKLAFSVDGVDVLLTDEERAIITSMRLPRGIHVSAVYRRTDFDLRQIRVRHSYQLVPDKSSELHFATFCLAAADGDFVFEVAMFLQEEKGLTLSREHMGLLHLDRYGMLTLTEFYGARDVSITSVPAREVPMDVRQPMFKLMKDKQREPFAAKDTNYDTRANQALWKIVEARKANQSYVLPHPAEVKVEQQALAAQLQSALDRHADEEAKTKKANAKAAGNGAKKNGNAASASESSTKSSNEAGAKSKPGAGSKTKKKPASSS